MSYIRAALLFIAVTVVPIPVHAASTSTIVLEVSTFRAARGILYCQLYTKRANFPERGDAEPALARRVPVTGTTTSCTFPNMPPGTYAAAVLHDENANGKMDKNVFGMPLEGYGISNNHTHALSRPTWEESKFEVLEGSTVTSRISLRY
jgi:uncharacterized protein (DUF2141 family)